MQILIAADHAGFSLKEVLKRHLDKLGHTVTDYGTHSDDSTDYPDYVHPLAKALAAGEGRLGVAVCGSANGVSMTANKHPHVRAAIAWQPELATLAREHNDANVLCLPARFVSEAQAQEILEAFLTARFEGGRHARRVAKIADVPA